MKELCILIIVGLVLLPLCAFGQAPVLAYSTLLGGSGNTIINGMALDSSGDIYVVGRTNSLSLATLHPFQGIPTTSECIVGLSPSPCNYGFIAKISADGSHLMYCSYIGDAHTTARAIAVDAAGNAYVTGDTNNDNKFPTVPPTNVSGAGHFTLKLNASGSALVYSTVQTGGWAIAVDAAQQAYIAGTAAQNMEPVNPLPGSICSRNSSASFSKLDASGTIIVATCLPELANSTGTAFGIALDAQNNIILAGEIFPRNTDYNFATGFTAKIAASGTLAYMTTFPGSSGYARAVTVDNNGNAWVVGGASGDFPAMVTLQPMMNGGAVLVRLDPAGVITYSAMFGGAPAAAPEAVTLDSAGNVYVAGNTSSTGFPTVNSLQPAYIGNQDAFVTAFTSDGSAILYSSYLGSSGDDQAQALVVSSKGTVYVAGTAGAADFPTVHSLQPYTGSSVLVEQGADAFVAKISAIATAAAPSIASITPATVAAGSTVTALVTGRNLGSIQSAGFSGTGISASVQASSTATNVILSITVDANAPVGVGTLTLTTSSGIAILPNSLTVINATVPSTSPMPITAVESGVVQTGYVIVTPDSGMATPVASLTYGMVSGGVVQSQASILPTALAGDNTIAVNLLPSAGRNLGVAVINPSAINATVTLTLRNSDGSAAGPVLTQTLLRGSQLARFVSELFPAYTLGSAFRGSLEVQGSQPLSVIGLSFSGNAFSTVPVLTSSPASAPGAIVFPQFAMGGGWATQLVLLNPTAATVTGSITLFNNAGTPWSFQLNGVTQSTFAYSIAPNGVFTLAPRDTNGQTPF